MRGASALESLLEEFPGDRIRVYVVWEPVLRSDIAPPITRVLALIHDGRARQFWDPGRALSAVVVRSVNGDPPRYGFGQALPADFVAWDVVAVFGPSSRWDRDLPPPAYYGGPVIESIDDARRAIRAGLEARAE